MRILFDQGTPVPFRNHLAGHQVSTAYEMGWSTLQNGELIKTAEASGFEVLMTTDQSWRYQQNLSGRSIAIVVLLTANWPKIQLRIADVLAAISSAKAGAYIEVAI